MGSWRAVLAIILERVGFGPQPGDDSPILLSSAQPQFVRTGPCRPIPNPGVVRRFFAVRVCLVKGLRQHVIFALVGAQLVFKGINVLKNII